MNAFNVYQVIMQIRHNRHNRFVLMKSKYLIPTIVLYHQSAPRQKQSRKWLYRYDDRLSYLLRNLVYHYCYLTHCHSHTRVLVSTCKV